MWSILFVYRILLPPLFLFRLCSPRPPEPQQGLKFNSDGAISKQISGKTYDQLDKRVPSILFQRDLNMSLFRGETTFPKVHAKNTSNSTIIDDERVIGGKHSSRYNSGNYFDNILEDRIPTFTNDDGDASNKPNFHNKTQQNNSYYLPNTDGLQTTAEKSFKLKGLPRLLSSFHQPSNMRRKLKNHSIYDFHHQLASELDKDFNSYRTNVKTDQVVKSRRRRSAHDRRRLHQFRLQSPKMAPPEYMVHLFQLLSGTHYEALRDTVVTCFVNINIEGTLETTRSTPSARHLLAFNLDISEDKEIIQHAELRLLAYTRSSNTFMNSNQRNSKGRSYNISIFSVHPYMQNNNGRKRIASKVVNDIKNGWIAFNITSFVRQWPPSSFQTLEARIDLPVCENGTYSTEEFVECYDDSSKSNDPGAVMDIEMAEGHEPLLVIFSKKTGTEEHTSSKRNKRDADMSMSDFLQLIDNEVESDSHRGGDSVIDYSKIPMLNGLNPTTVDQAEETSPYSNTQKHTNSALASNNFTFLNAKKSLRPYTDNALLQTKSGHPRRLEHSAEKSTRFKEIGLLEHFNSLSRFEGSTPSDSQPDHIPRRRLRRDTLVRYKRHLDSLFKNPPRKNGRRAKRSKKRRNSCRRKEMIVNFEKIKWDKVIVFPIKYQAFECTGKCYTPISEYLTPTKHAIIQTLVHTSYPQQASRACCVPTKLDPISILYWDEHGNIKYEYTYEGMVVAECGCR